MGMGLALDLCRGWACTRSVDGQGARQGHNNMSGDNEYYQTLIKYLILLLIQPLAQDQTRRGGLVHPLPVGCMGPIRLM